MTKTKKYTHSVNIKLTPEQFEQMKTIKEKSGKSISELMRQNIVFLLFYYTSKKV